MRHPIRLLANGVFFFIFTTMKYTPLFPVLTLCLSFFAVPAWSDDSASVSKNVDAKRGGVLIESHKDSKDLVVLDVRTAGEFGKSRIAGAKNIDVLATDFKVKAKQLDKNKSYLVHCRSGKRSQTAFKALKSLGFTKLYHLDGGMLAWEAAKLPVDTSRIKAAKR
jgi:rhodanese-related sulfurtransferase